MTFNRTEDLVEMLAQVDWSSVKTAPRTNALLVPDALIELSQVAQYGEAERAYWRLDNTVVVQGTVYPAGVHVVQPCLLIIDSRNGASTDARAQALLLLGELTGYYSADLETDLVEMCRVAIRGSIAIIRKAAQDQAAEVRNYAIDVLGWCDSDLPYLKDELTRIVANDPSDKVRDSAQYWLGEIFP